MEDEIDQLDNYDLGEQEPEMEEQQEQGDEEVEQLEEQEPEYENSSPDAGGAEESNAEQEEAQEDEEEQQQVDAEPSAYTEHGQDVAPDQDEEEAEASETYLPPISERSGPQTAVSVSASATSSGHDDQSPSHDQRTASVSPSKARTEQPFVRVHHIKPPPRSIQSAPTTPSGGMSARTMRNRTARVTTDKMSEDVWALARSLLEEREANERLLQAIRAKAEAATTRKTVISPAPTLHVSTPLSLVSKASPTGVVQRPPGWKDSWRGDLPPEVRAGDHQVQSGLTTVQRQSHDAFEKEMAQKKAEAEAAAKRAEQERVAAEARQRARQAKENQAVQACALNLETRRQHVEEVLSARHTRSSQLLESVNTQLMEKLQKAADLREQQILAAKQRQDEYDQERQQIKEADHAVRSERRAASADRRYLVYQNVTQRCQQQHKNDGDILVRAQRQRSKSQTRFQQRFEQVSQSQERAVTMKEQRLQQISQGLAAQTTESFQQLRERAAELEKMRQERKVRIYEKHERLLDEISKREKQVAEREAYLTKKHVSTMFTIHWAKELAQEAAIKNRLPEIRPDVKEDLERHNRLRQTYG